jgi:O-antigen/teichoic acid export membrane protein
MGGEDAPAAARPGPIAVSEAAAPRSDGPRDVEALAEGSGTIFLGGIVDKSVRLVTLWLLARVLGPATFGLYTTATTVVTLVQMISPLGADSAALLFAARAGKDRARLKGTVQTVLLLGLGGGALGTVALLLGRSFADAPLSSALGIVAPAVLVGSLAAVLSALLQAAGRFQSFVLATLVVWPTATLLAVVVGLAVGGLDAVLVAYVVGGVAALTALGWSAWGALGPLLRERTIEPARDVRGLLAFSIPQSLSKVLWQFNLWTDVLMLSWLSTTADVGIYRVALSVAMLGTLPVMALTTAMNPRAAALVHTGELARLDHLVKVGTRTLLLILAPCFLLLALLPQQLLGLFDPAYERGAPALLALVAGQAIYVLAGPTGSLLAMGGYARVNLANNLLAVALNVALNFALIPRMGVLGAALASVTAQLAWALARTIEVKVLLRCFAFEKATVALVAVGAVTVGILTLETSGTARIVATAIAVPLYTAAIWKLGGTAEEAEMLRSMVGKLRARLGR